MRPVTTAVILAAGMGLRLEGLGRQIPKGFLRLGKLPIVQESVVRLRHVGIQRIVIVTGHLAEFYLDLQARYPGLVETVANPRFAESGSMLSLYEARHSLNEDFLLLESDLIYEPRALRECLDFPQDNVILLSGPTGSGDEVFVVAPGGRLAGMSKDRRQVEPDVCGELVGISRISTSLYQTMLTVAERLFAGTGHFHFHYETDVLVAAARLTSVYCHLVPDLVWAEIDDRDHLRRAESLVYPAIVAKEAGPRELLLADRGRS